jgi:hypothetical protein
MSVLQILLALNLNSDFFLLPSADDEINRTQFRFGILDQFKYVTYLFRMGDTLDFLRRLAKQIFQLPAVLTMAVAATRMHRSLVNFTHRPSDACVIFHRFHPSLA